MSSFVNQHQLSSYATPVAGGALAASVVLSNDNTTVTGYNAHDADATIHVQDSSLASKPAASVTGRKWMTVDSTAVALYFDTGSNWLPLNTFPAAITITSTTTPQLTVAYDGSNQVAISVSSAGAITYAATGASASFSFNNTLNVSTGDIVASNGELSARTTSASGSPKISLYQSSTERVALQYSNADGAYVADSDGQIILKTNNTLALTINNAQAAAFVGAVTAASFGGVTIASGAITATGMIQTTLTTQQLALLYDASNHLAVTVSSAGAVTYNATGASAAHLFSDPVTVTGQVSASTILTAPHIVGSGSAPSATPGAAAGASPSASITTGTDLSGQVSVTTGASGTGAGIIVTVTFATAYATAPKAVLVMGADATTSAFEWFEVDASDISTTDFDIRAVTGTPATLTTYNLYYVVIA